MGLFCKRALQKRRYSAKETYSFKEPTNRSQAIAIDHTKENAQCVMKLKRRHIMFSDKVLCACHRICVHVIVYVVHVIVYVMVIVYVVHRDSLLNMLSILSCLLSCASGWVRVCVCVGARGVGLSRIAKNIVHSLLSFVC